MRLIPYFFIGLRLFNMKYQAINFTIQYFHFIAFLTYVVLKWHLPSSQSVLKSMIEIGHFLKINNRTKFM